jgi:hypothetical protein
VALQLRALAALLSRTKGLSAVSLSRTSRLAGQIRKYTLNRPACLDKGKPGEHAYINGPRARN